MVQFQALGPLTSQCEMGASSESVVFVLLYARARDIHKDMLGC